MFINTLPITVMYGTLQFFLDRTDTVSLLRREWIAEIYFL